MSSAISVLLFGLIFKPLLTHARWLTKGEAGSVIELFDAVVSVKRSGASAVTVTYAVRVQSEDAKTSAGRFAIDYNSATDRVEVLEAYTMNGRERIAVESTAIEDRDQGESKDYDAVKVRSIVFPQVQIGSRLFVKYRSTTDKPLVSERWSDRFSLWPTAAMEKFRYRVDSEVPLYLEVNDPEKYLKVKKKDPLHVEVINARELPGGVQAERDPFWHPKRVSEIFLTTDREWSSFFGGLNLEYQKVLDQPLPKTLVAWVMTARNLNTPEERAYHLMQKMSETFRYFGDWRRHDGGLIPRTLTEIERSRYGDCKDLASVLAGLLRRLDLRADVTLIRRGENPWGREPDYASANIGRFNHAITRLEVAPGKVYWLDPTNPVASLEPLADVSGRPTLLLTPTGPRIDRVPEAKPADYAQETEYSYAFGLDGGAKVELKSSFLGLGAARLANSLMLMPRAQVLSDVLDYFDEGHEIKHHRFTLEPKTGRRLGRIDVGLKFDADKITYTAGPDAFFVLPEGFLAGAFYETEDRESDLRLNDMPFTARSTRRLRGVQLAQDPPAECTVDTDWFKVSRRVASLPKDVVITQDIELKKAFVTRDETRSQAFRRAQTESRACFSHAGVLIRAR